MSQRGLRLLKAACHRKDRSSLTRGAAEKGEVLGRGYARSVGGNVGLR